MANPAFLSCTSAAVFLEKKTMTNTIRSVKEPKLRNDSEMIGNVDFHLLLLMMKLAPKRVVVSEM